MKEQFVTYEIALQLKEKGFKEEVLATYDTEKTDSRNELKIFAFSVPNKGIFEEGFNRGWCIRAPLWQQAIDWLRGECFNIVIFPVNDRTEWFYGINVVTWQACDRSVLYKSYEEAREQAILKALPLIQ